VLRGEQSGRKEWEQVRRRFLQRMQPGRALRKLRAAGAMRRSTPEMGSAGEVERGGN
jgi:hypothetical protein